MYVAMTRAKNELSVTYPLNVYNTRRSSDYSLDQLSRFIDRGVRKAFQRVALETVVEQAPGTTGAHPTVDLMAAMRNRFGGPPKS